eukprot:145575-Pyramimonas_sp.AAC.1
MLIRGSQVSSSAPQPNTMLEAAAAADTLEHWAAAPERAGGLFGARESGAESNGTPVLGCLPLSTFLILLFCTSRSALDAPHLCARVRALGISHQAG